MALRSVPAETLPGAATAHRGTRRRAPAPRAAAIQRSPARTCKILDDVPTLPQVRIAVPARDLYRDHPGKPRRADAPGARENEGLMASPAPHRLARDRRRG